MKTIISILLLLCACAPLYISNFYIGESVEITNGTFKGCTGKVTGDYLNNQDYQVSTVCSIYPSWQMPSALITITVNGSKLRKI